MPSNSRSTCYFGCENFATLHRFPKPVYPNIEKFNEWKKILNKAILEKGDKYIYNQIRLCYKHFEKYYYTRGKRLTANAIPTLVPYVSGEEDREPAIQEDEPAQVTVSEEEHREPAIHEDVISDNTFSDEEDGEPAIHEDVICDNCSGNIISFRYKCVTCDNYDLCQKCEMLELHSNHYMLRIPLCLRFEFAGNFIVKLREVLKCDQTLLAPTKHTDKAHKAHKTVIQNVNNNDKDIVDIPENDKRKIQSEVDRTKGVVDVSEKDGRRIQSEVDRSLKLAKIRKNNKENNKRPPIVISDSRVIKKQRTCKENKITVQVHKVKNINNVAGEIVIEHAPELVFDKRKIDFHENTETTDECSARHQEQQDNVRTFYMKTGIDLSQYMIQVIQNSEEPT